MRQAIVDANASPGSDQINFTILGAGPHVISPLSPLPEIVDTVEIDGTTSTIEIDGSGAGSGTHGFVISCGGCTVANLTINRFSGKGILLSAGGGNTIRGNRIGTSVDGLSDFGNNQNGIEIASGASNNLNGGTTTTDRNVISANDMNGILIKGAVTQLNTIEGNYIGTDATGAAALGNTLDGVRLEDSASSNTIGGTLPGCRNIVSGNGRFGIAFASDFAANNSVDWNYIGTDLTGQIAVGNGGYGVYVNGHDNVIGSSMGFERNVISGNVGGGVWLSGTRATGNLIATNMIGPDANGNPDIGNTEHGVLIDGGASFNDIGLNSNSTNNRIAANGGDAIAIDNGSVANSIGNNSILFNDGMGIDLGLDGVTPNDADDTDEGANNLQNYPVLTLAATNGSQTAIAGTLTSLPDRQYLIRFYSGNWCDASGHGEGPGYRGAVYATTDGSGAVNFSVVVGYIPVTHHISATAEDPAGNTSEFSECIFVESMPYKLQLLDGDDPPQPIADGQATLYRTRPGQGEITLGDYTTDANGLIAMPPTVLVGDVVRATMTVHEEPRVKDSTYYSSMYGIEIDNGARNTITGEFSYDTIGATDSVLVLDHTTVALDLVVLLQWDASADYILSMSDGLRRLCNYMHDVTDGQLRLRDVLIKGWSPVGWLETADMYVRGANDGPPVDSPIDAMRMRNGPISVPLKWFGHRGRGPVMSYAEHPLDLNDQINVIFFNGADTQDELCPATRADFNDDGVPDSSDLNDLIAHLFFNGPLPTDPCAP